LLVSFPGDGLTLRGFLYRPGGEGEHPAVVWNHGSEPQPDPFEALGDFYTASGYVFFAPHRRGHGRSPGEYELGGFRPELGSGATVREQAIRHVIELYERHLADLEQAVRWLGRQPCVDGGRVAMGGVSHGAVLSLLAAEADLGPGAYVTFAPGAMAWADNPELRDRLRRAVLAARAPIFLLQARNDYDLGPSRVLGRELARKGPPNACRVYLPYGTTQATGHGAFACHGSEIWGDDVRRFLGDVL
jgi:carboxymethylenebutenolidase